ncbi:hypothetical protein [Salinarimonas ramus]|uniref:hypothetical protein n=1 Tax=Salinarimonas ramus TaxID=690164 RepID=UPI00357125A2
MDENLTPILADMAHERGHGAMAVRDLGLLNAKDWTVNRRWGPAPIGVGSRT